MQQNNSSLRPQLLFFSIIAVLFVSGILYGKRSGLVPTDMPGFVTQQRLPDFASITDVDEKKAAFFDFLQPYVDAENRQILAHRVELERILDKLRNGQGFSRRESAFISSISEEYQIDTVAQETVSHLRQLLRRVDILPSSLVLAQAANESAWGTSRFAVEGNNLFGQWCYTSGCGLVPNQRLAGADHEVKAFDSVAESIHAYFMNLNTFPSYQKLRRIRQQMREQGREIDSISLTEGLDSYSERGEAYIEELQSMINFNDLQNRDGQS
ncbi:MAG: glucosaminidase domain-containing protein, partial [Pseudohongiellaceae bacterium]